MHGFLTKMPLMLKDYLLLSAVVVRLGAFFSLPYLNFVGCFQSMRVNLMIILSLASLCTFAQSNWGSMETIYDDGTLKVELQFLYSENSCDFTGTPFKYRYRLNGTLPSETRYLSWKMDYISCKGESFYEQISLPIGGPDAIQNFGIEQLKDKIYFDDLNSMFIASVLVKPFYDVMLTSAKLSNLGKKVFTHVNDTASGWGTIQSIYSDSNINVELQFYYSKNSCDDGGKAFKYRYRLNGYVNKNFEQYLTWKMNYKGCNGELFFEQIALPIGGAEAEQNFGTGQLMDLYFYDPLNFKFTCLALVEPFYDVKLSALKSTGIGKPQYFISKEPTGILGEKNLRIGQSTELKVKDGSLGMGAQWVWYRENCGVDSIGVGESITVNPADTTTYYVRAEGRINKTACAKITINVDARSTSPLKISGNTKVCKGLSTQLSVVGGSLGLDAEWVWYANDCNGSKIGKGISINVQSSSTTTYLVRAESRFNTTAAAKIQIEVFENSTDPDSIFCRGPKIICEGEKVLLEVKGGKLAKDATWKWSLSSCTGDSENQGNSVEFKPMVTSTYFVSGKGFCNTTNCVFVTIQVNRKSQSPAYISGELIKYKKAILTVQNGELGKDADWFWYKKSCKRRKAIGRGESIVIKTRKPTKYFVKAKGLCNETNCSEILINPIKKRSLDKTYASNYKKLVHFGVGGGLEWLQLSELANYKTTTVGVVAISDSMPVNISGFGVKGEISFYPYMKDYLSLGFIASGAVTFKEKTQMELNTLEHFYYKRFSLETELAFGFNPVKALFKLKRGSVFTDYSSTYTLRGNVQEKSLNQTVYSETISAGLRFGRYEKKTKYKRGNSFDVLATFTKNEGDINALKFADYNGFSNWQVGGALSYWRQSAIRFQFDVRLNTLKKDFNFKTADYSKANYQISLILNLNLFY